MEKWKDIEGYNGIYQVSDLGRIKSKPRNGTKGGILTGKITQFGYHVILLRLNNKRAYKFAHRLVAESFIPNPNKLPQVNHKDEKKLNNNADNLEWCTAKYNINYGTLPERKSENRKGFRFTSESRIKMSKSQIKIAKRGRDSPYAKKVYQFDKDMNFIREWGSLTEVERQLNYHHSNVGAVARGVKKTAYGFIWSYQSPKLDQIGCGYCAKEGTCTKRNPKINKAKQGCKEWKHWET